MGSLSVIQQIFLVQELSQGFLLCRRILYQLSYREAHLGVRDAYLSLVGDCFSD